MQIDLLRNIFCYIRYFFLKRNLKVLDGLDNIVDISNRTLRQNLLGLKETGGERTHQLIRPLVSIEKILRTQNKLTVLSIGPRTEAEIFNLWAYGFKLKNIKGLDILSYSKHIQVGDMHDMPFDSSSRDIVMAGWVIVYSDNPKKAAQEIVRVSKNNGTVAVTASYDNTPDLDVAESYGTVNKKRFNSLDSIKEAFDGHIDFIYFQQDIDPLFKNDIATATLIFRVKK